MVKDDNKGQLLSQIHALVPGRFGPGLANRPAENLAAILEELQRQQCTFENGPLAGRVEYHQAHVTEREVPLPTAPTGPRHAYKRTGPKTFTYVEK